MTTQRDPNPASAANALTSVVGHLEAIGAQANDDVERPARALSKEDLLRRANADAQVLIDVASGETVQVAGLLVGTAEAAAILGVERPRIGRWIALGKLPEPVARLAATPVWLRTQIEDMRPAVNARRRPRRSRRPPRES
jgi:hypothetical protein